MNLSEGQYTIQGVNVLDISRKFGTPLYVYDADKIRSQYQEMVKAFAGLKCKIKYPAKAAGNINILRWIKKLGGGLDTVSIQEVELGLMAGFKPEEIIFTPNCVSFDEIRQGVEKRGAYQYRQYLDIGAVWACIWRFGALLYSF